MIDVRRKRSTGNVWLLQLVVAHRYALHQHAHCCNSALQTDHNHCSWTLTSNTAYKIRRTLGRAGRKVEREVVVRIFDVGEAESVAGAVKRVHVFTRTQRDGPALHFGRIMRIRAMHRQIVV